jgi:hypothetical protein
MRNSVAEAVPLNDDGCSACARTDVVGVIWRWSGGDVALCFECVLEGANKLALYGNLNRPAPASEKC